MFELLLCCNVGHRFNPRFKLGISFKKFFDLFGFKKNKGKLICIIGLIYSYQGDATYNQKYKGKKSVKVIKKLSNVLVFEYKQARDLVLFNIEPDSPYRRLPSSIKIYLEIESELSKLSGEKLDQYSTAAEDYQKQLLYPAIERVAGNSLSIIENDKEFETKLIDQVNKYTSIYYKVAYNYKLPTIRIVPFLIRLISY